MPTRSSTPAEIDELRGLADVEVNDKEVAMAEALVDSLSADFEPMKYHDEYREQVLALIQMKADGEAFEAPEVVSDKPKVVDIMAALEASVAAAKDARSRHPSDVATKKVTQKSAAKAKPAKGAAKKAAPKKSAAKAKKSA